MTLKASGRKEERYFLAPCMLQQETPEEIISPKPNSQIESSPVLCYVFTGNFLPSAIFHRLVAACIAHWPVAKKKKEHIEENLIFCGCCVFKLDEQHKLTLHFREHVIFLRVTRMGIKDKTPSSKLCIEVREFITRNLLKIIGYLGQGLKFEYFIQCPEYNGVSINSLIPVSRLETNAEVHCEFHDNMIESCKVLDFWFKDQVKNIDGQDKDDVDTPITQEHINHARLCNALTSVCSNALKEILLTNVPKPHPDIYKAILANKPKLNKLNKDQVQLVFPDPQGLSTGKVEEFDISLLYTIIRNVSSVPVPSNGWGKHPTDNPRDTTLGASVERIRTYRNHISGHSVDGRISQQEFEDYWVKIDEVLREIEIVIGNHGYLEDLEKRKNQAITPHEANELQKTFQEYKKQTEANTDIQDQVLPQAHNVRSKTKSLPNYQFKGVPCSDPKLLCQLLQKSQQAASANQSTLEANCLSVGLELHGETPADGNCFFEAVSSQLRRLNCVVQKSPQELRQEVVAFIRANRVIQASEGTIHLDSFIYNESFDVYCSRMARDGEWADHVVVVAMARMLQIDIMIVTSSPSSGPENIIVWVVGKTAFQEDPILLGHVWESHYMSLQPIGPSVDDTDRFMHIACLLVNVGSRVLRRLLLYHTVTLTCTLDQYLAKKRLDIDNLRKRKIVNKSQMDILFPPSGSTNLCDYDISLLSALFTNLVHTISHQQLNMIQSLRDKRNEIFAHAKSVTVNLNDYQTFWNDICRTLEALSKQCNDPDFENEISKEIQGIQASTVLGTSLLDTLQSHPRRMETLERLVQNLISSHTQELNKESDDSDS